MKEQKFIQNLQNLVRTYDRILFLPYKIQGIVSLFSNYPKEGLKKKILLLSKDTLYSRLDGIDWIQLDEESSTMLRHLYHTYEFSDKFRILSTDENFGTIWNYTKTGILSPEEAVSALLG